MPSASLSFRHVCGCFVYIFQKFMSKRIEQKIAVRKMTLKPRTLSDGVTLGLLLSFLFYGNLLILSGDIELNPGPPKSNGRQMRLTSEGRTTRATSSNNIQSETSSNTEPPSKQPTLRDVMDLLTSITSSLDQPSSEIADTNQPAATVTPTDTSTTEHLSSNNITSLLQDMTRKFDEMRTNLVQLSNMCTKIQNEILDMKEEMETLKEEHEELRKENCLLNNRIEAFERKVDKQEFDSKRRNLIFHNVPRKENETNAECEQSIRKLLNDSLQITEDLQFDRVQRLNKNSNSPIVACFTFFQQRQLVFKSRHKLKDSEIFVSPDFPLRIREIRRKLLPFLKKAKEEGKKAFLIYDHLIVEGNKYCLDKDNLKMLS